MKKYIVWINTDGTTSEREYTNYLYEMGETINVNTTEVYKCIEITSRNNEIIHFFKQGEVTYNFDW